MKGKKLPVQKSRVYEADVTLRHVVVNIRAVSREEAEKEAKEMFWEHMRKMKTEPEVGIVLRRLL